jgi:hypothetical protein
MKKESSSPSETGEEGGFCRLLREVQEGRKPEGAIFEDETFRRKFTPIINAHANNASDRADLANGKAAER